jgi:hypothetical protein
MRARAAHSLWCWWRNWEIRISVGCWALRGKREGRQAVKREKNQRERSLVEFGRMRCSERMWYQLTWRRSRMCLVPGMGSLLRPEMSVARRVLSSGVGPNMTAVRSLMKAWDVRPELGRKRGAVLASPTTRYTCRQPSRKRRISVLSDCIVFKARFQKASVLVANSIEFDKGIASLSFGGSPSSLLPLRRCCRDKRSSTTRMPLTGLNPRPRDDAH